MGLDDFKQGTTAELSIEQTREEYEEGPPEDTSIREWIADLESRSTLTKDEILIGGTDDPMWCGTKLDHKKAQWFKELWKEAISDREDDSVHVRGVHYYVVMRDKPVKSPTSQTEWDVYENSGPCFQYLSSASFLARILDYVPFEGIEDRKNETERVIEYQRHNRSFTIGRPNIEGTTIPEFSNPDKIAEAAFEDVDSFQEYVTQRFCQALRKGIRFDHASQQPYHIELWSEKALPDEIIKTARDAGVNVLVTGQGQLSLQVARNAVDRINEAGKPAVILYLCDYDAAGDWMPPAMARKVEWFRKRGFLEYEVVIDVLAITEKQIHEYDLPPKPAGNSDLAKSREQRLQQNGIVELNALEGRMDVFKTIVRDKVSELTDDDLDAKNEEATEQATEELEDRVESAIEEVDELDEAIQELQAWIDEHNELIEEASELIQNIREHKEDEGYERWKRTQRKIRKSVDVPEVDVPSGEADLPSAPLYDSRRNFDENVQHIQEFRHD